MDARRRRGGSSGSSDEEEYDRDGAEDRGESAAGSGSVGMQCEVVAILMGKGRDIFVVRGKIERRRSMYKYSSSMVVVVIALRIDCQSFNNPKLEVC